MDRKKAVNFYGQLTLVFLQVHTLHTHTHPAISSLGAHLYKSNLYNCKPFKGYILLERMQGIFGERSDMRTICTEY